MKRGGLLLVLCAAARSEEWKAGPLTLEVHVSRTANLFEIVDNLSNWDRYAHAQYRRHFTLSDEDEAAIAEAAKTVAIVKSGNMSVGVNVLTALVEHAARTLDESFDIESFEAHHRAKADAPSGTALMLGRAAAKGRGFELEDLKAAADRSGVRKTGDIGFSVFRGGGVVGEHRVSFASMQEVIALSHSAIDRGLFAKGAVAAARWAVKQPPGLYSMRDVLGLG